jgi:O-antigen/teichoic acid export membrane protein
LAANVLGTVGAAGAGFVSTVLMGRWLALDDFGFIMVMLIAFNAIAALDGLRPVVIYEAAQPAGSRTDLRAAAVSAGLGLAVLVGVASAVAASVLVIDRLGWTGIALFSIGLALYFPMSIYWGLLDADGRTAFTGIARSLAWIAVYALFAGLAAIGAPAAAFAAGFASMNAALLFVYWIHAPRADRDSPAAGVGALMRRLLRQASNIVAFNLSALVMGSVDRAALVATSGVATMGMYSGAYELATKPSALFRVASQVLFPEAARGHAAGVYLVRLWVRATALGFAGVSAAVGIAVAWRAELLALILGAKFADASDAFGILLVGFSLVVLGYACAVILNAQGNFSLQRNCYALAAAAMAVAAWPMARLGLLGAAALYLASRLVDPVLFVLTAKRVDALPSVAIGLLIVVSHAGLMTAAWHASWPGVLAAAAALAAGLARWHGQVLIRRRVAA